jgi:hypothetical protein
MSNYDTTPRLAVENQVRPKRNHPEGEEQTLLVLQINGRTMCSTAVFADKADGDTVQDLLAAVYAELDDLRARVGRQGAQVPQRPAEGLGAMIPQEG